TCGLPLCPVGDASVPLAVWSGEVSDLSLAEGVELWAIAEPVARAPANSNEKNQQKPRNFMGTNALLKKHYEPLNCMFLNERKQGCRREIRNANAMEALQFPPTLVAGKSRTRCDERQRSFFGDLAGSC
ncbi:MAG: hypothetical protein WCC92_14710, partial [Candidatus Korobacteraceae bacterium]